jgi:hypothetical protein
VSVKALTTKQFHTRVGELIFDRLVSETMRFPGSVTAYPVEDGAVNSDHIYLEPEQVTMEGEKTNTPIRILGGRLTLEGPDFSPRKNFCQEALDYMIKAWQDKTLLTVVGRYRTYTDMAIVGFEMPRAAGDGEKIRIQVTLKKVTKVKIKTLEFQPNRTKKESGQPKQKTGPKEAQAAPPPAARRQSFLKFLVGG